MILKILPLSIFFILYIVFSPYKSIFEDSYAFFQEQEFITKTLVDRYRSGPLKNVSACFDENIHEDYFKCNIDAFKCSFKYEMGYPLKYNHFSIDTSSIELISSQTHQYQGRPSYLVNITYKKNTFYVLFPKRCHISYLPENIYTFQTEEKDLLWDTYHRSISVDKFLVRQKDINEWVFLTKEHLHLYSNKNQALPATTLNDLEKHQYCAFMQGKILEMNVYDAITSSPTLLVIKYPWSEISNNDSLCHVRYTKECLNEFITHYPYSPSSYGIYEVLGPYAQFIYNFYEPLYHQNFTKDKSSKDESFSRKFKEMTGKNAGFRCQYDD